MPAILEMARRFGVGPPTVREALKKLETLGVVDVRHGSGVYVASRRELLVLARPQLGREMDGQILADLIEVRIPLEVEAVRAAALRASVDELASIRHLVNSVEGDIDERRLASTDAAFHRQLAAISGNTILAQLLDALRDLFTDEGRIVHWGPLARDCNAREHSAIVDALELRDQLLASQRIRAHLEGVRDAFAAVRGVQRTA